MDDLKIALAVLDNDPIEAAGLRYERLLTIINALYDEAMEQPKTRLSGLAGLALSEIEQADAEYRALIGVNDHA